MTKIWCEGPGEFRDFDEAEFRDYDGVLVHMTGHHWHLTDGNAIEMASDGTPVLEGTRPVVVVGDISVTEAETFGAFEVAPKAGPDFIEPDRGARDE